MRSLFSSHPSHVIVGIHGLKNKPPKKILRDWWIASLREGLKLAGYPDRVFSFELVYWARHLYSKPLNPREKRAGHPLFLDEPYVVSSKNVIEEKKKKRSFLFRPLFRKTLNKVFLSTKTGRDAERITDTVLEHTFPDLVLYFDNEHVFNLHKGVKDLLREELARVLHRYKNSQILLIAHSMGSIIAFDVLHASQNTIHVLVTVGSPLALPFVRKRFMQEHGMDFSEKIKIPCPNAVTEQWKNLADAQDVVAFDSALADNYTVNSHAIGVEDSIVVNDYVYHDKQDHHSIYGYLRCKETASVVNSFLTSKPVTFFEKVMLWWRKKVE